MHSLLLPIGDDLYAIETAQVREVVAAPTLTPLPTAPSQVLGIFNLRGDIVPVFDLAAILGVGSTDVAPFVVVADTLLGPAGFAATAPAETAELDEAIGASDTPGAVATYAVGRRVVVLVDVSALLVPARVAG